MRMQTFAKRSTIVFLLICLLFTSYFQLPNVDVSISEASSIATNGTMMQYFEWDLPNTGTLWNQVASEAPKLKNVGITALWLPPAYKGEAGINDVGYGVYDLYDLGEFNQKGSIRTKYGTRTQYLNAINTAKANGLQIYADVVFNHLGGADATEWVEATRVASNNRNHSLGDKWIQAWTSFNYPVRNGKYSNFVWKWYHFDGVDWDQSTGEKAVFRFKNQSWDWEVDTENGNYDYLMYADLNMDHPEVINELKNWGRWYLNTTKVDGFRIDAIKHIRYNFFTDWLGTLRSETGKELFAVGEFWSPDINKLHNYISKSQGTMSLFDAPIHYRFKTASDSSGNYDMRTIWNNTLMKDSPTKAVTLVDNHDTQPGQSLESWVQPWFKPLAYTFILTRQEGYPCVFYGDYYGIPKFNIPAMKDKLDPILLARKDYAYGKQNDYLDHHDIIGWTREGITERPGSGLASLISDGPGGSKRMFVGTRHAGKVWHDITGNRKDTVTIGNDGWATFHVNGGSNSIWVEQQNGNTVTIYYKRGYSTPYIHYRPVGGTWTTTPGRAMQNSEVAGYSKITINIGPATQLEACFNNGSGTWDSNGGRNYFFNVGTSTYNAGTITSGVPK